MPKILLKAPLVWYERGYERCEYEAGEADVSDECAAVALSEGWAEQLGEQANGGQAIEPATGELVAADFADTQPVEAAAEPAAPETTDAAQQRRRKAAPSA